MKFYFELPIKSEIEFGYPKLIRNNSNIHKKNISHEIQALICAET
jgi:hypothetical protein